MAKQDKDIIIQRFKDIMGAMTQKQFADKLHTTQTTISKILSGKNEPSLSILKTLSTEYGISIDWLLGLSEVKQIQNISIQKLTYPYILSVFCELIKNGNISFSYVDNPAFKTEDLLHNLYDAEHIASLVLNDVVLKKLTTMMNEEINISKKSSDSWSSDRYDDFQEILDWNDDQVRYSFMPFYKESPTLFSMYQSAIQDKAVNNTSSDLAVPPLDEFIKDKPIIDET